MPGEIVFLHSYTENLNTVFLSARWKTIERAIIALAMAFAAFHLRRGFEVRNEFDLVHPDYFSFLTVGGILLAVCLKRRGISGGNILGLHFLLFLATLFFLSAARLMLSGRLSVNGILMEASIMLPSFFSLWWGSIYVLIYTAVPERPYRLALILPLLLTARFLMNNFTDFLDFWMWLFNWIPGVGLAYIVKGNWYSPPTCNILYEISFW